MSLVGFLPVHLQGFYGWLIFEVVDWALLNNRDIRDKYVLELRNRFETLQEKTKKVHQTTNMKISSMHTSRQQRNAFQQNSKLNIESHGKL